MKRLLFAIPAMLLAAPAFAGTTDNLAVTAEVVDNCNITGGTLDFSTYDALGTADKGGATTVSVACTTGAVAVITLGQGLHAEGTSTPAAPLRQMASGANNLRYGIYADASYTTAWGDTAGTGQGYTATDTSTVAIDVYGRIVGAQHVPAGTYTDTVVATVTF